MTAPGGFSSGDVLTAADMNALSGPILAENANSTNVSLTTSPTEVTAVTATVKTGRAYLIGFTCRNMSAAQSNTIIDFYLNLTGGSSLTQFRKFLVNTSSRESLTMLWIINPTSDATNEYTIDVETSTGTGTLFGGTYDLQMWIQDLGESV